MQAVVLAGAGVARPWRMVTGASEEFEALVREHVPAWIAAARRLAGQDAEDVVFRVLEKLWDGFRRGTVPRDSLGAYGMRAVQNEAVDQLRRRRREPVAAAEEPAGGADPLDEVLARDGRAQLARTLATLDEEDRRVVELRAFEERSYDAIARGFRDAGGAPRSGEWAKKRFQRACQRLHAVARRLLGEGGGHGA